MPRITNWLEVERRLANYNTSIKTIETSLVKTNNSRNIMLHALLINLKDLLESQSEISLWFYDIDEPTTSTLPYTSWSTPSEHYGDIFYSRTKGVIYQFKTSGKWEQLNDVTLLNSMALTNSKLESGDHERQVFTTDPTPPYESGDWWIQSDGTLFICQIGRETGARQPNDFINSLDYAEALAKATDNILEVLKGTVIQTTDNAVTYLDKATNTTTTISGNSIKTGELISNNYLSGTRGTLISLDDGTITTRYFKLSSTGEITATGGEIGGFVLDSRSFTHSFYRKYDYDGYDVGLALNVIHSSIDDTDKALLPIYDLSGDGRITISDVTQMIADLNGQTTISHYVSGSVEINSSNPKHCISVKSSNGISVCSMGVAGIHTSFLATNNFVCGYYSGTSFYGLSINNNGDVKTTGNISCNSLTQTSLEKNKKNFEKLDNGLDIVLNTDIYKYNFINDDDKAKKHIGFVIGENYNYSHEITAVDKNDNEIGVDTYSMISVAYKAIQELQEQINKLKEVQNG